MTWNLKYIMMKATSHLTTLSMMMKTIYTSGVKMMKKVLFTLILKAVS